MMGAGTWLVSEYGATLLTAGIEKSGDLNDLPFAIAVYPDFLLYVSGDLKLFQSTLFGCIPALSTGLHLTQQDL